MERSWRLRRDEHPNGHEVEWVAVHNSGEWHQIARVFYEGGRWKRQLDPGLASAYTGPLPTGIGMDERVLAFDIGQKCADLLFAEFLKSRNSQD